MFFITKIEPLGKARYEVTFDNGCTLILYRAELRTFSMEEGKTITEAQWEVLIRDVVGKRAKKRAMHLLEKMDYTEQQLRDKLVRNRYPEECVEAAIAYVKRFRYVDDARYAEHYVQMAQDRMSKGQLRQKLMSKGVARDLIEQSVEEFYEADEEVQIRALLDKKHYDSQSADAKETQRMYQFLLRRGFRSNDILRVMKGYEQFD